MTKFFTIPGYLGSGPGHWQTRFEESFPNFERIHQSDWNHPDIESWVNNIEARLKGIEDTSSVVLVAHSLGCLTVAEWAARYHRNIKGAILVAPPDTELIKPKVKNQNFDHSVYRKLPFPTKLVVSCNDHWAGLNKLEKYAELWGSELINIGSAGHINAESGHGDWPLGLEIVRSYQSD